MPIEYNTLSDFHHIKHRKQYVKLFTEKDDTVKNTKIANDNNGILAIISFDKTFKNDVTSLAGIKYF